MKCDRARLVPFVALLASACGAGDGDSTLNHYGAEMSESVVGVEASLSSHQDKVLAETDLESLRGMEREHMDDMGMHMGRMQAALDSMKLCGSHMSMTRDSEAVDQLHAAQGAMADAMGSAFAESERHLRAMQGAPDLDAARAEEGHHQVAMDELLGGMRMHDESLGSAMQMMADDGMSMMCPMSSHMHH